MSTQDCTSIARSIYDAFNRRDFDYALSCADEKMEWTTVATGETVRGREAFRQNLQDWATAFPDGKVEIKNVFGGDDWVCVEFVGRGTHSGPMTGPMGQIAPTGRRVELWFCEVYHCRNGKFVSGRSYFDMASMMSQLGLMDQRKAA